MQATHTVEIARPVATVFAFVADGETAPRWRSGVLDVTLVSGEGVGSTYRQGVKGPMGRRVAADYRVTAFVPDSRLEFEGTAGPVRPRGTFLFEAAGAGTRVTFTLEAELTGLRKLVMGSTVARSMTAETQALGRLKVVLESSERG